MSDRYKEEIILPLKAKNGKMIKHNSKAHTKLTSTKNLINK